VGSTSLPWWWWWSWPSSTPLLGFNLVQLGQHLLALVLLLPSSVQGVLWATHQWWACSFSHSQPIAWGVLWASLLTSSLWPQGVFISCSENFCESFHVEEGGIYRVGHSLWCWHLFYTHLVTRVNSTNVLDEGHRIGEVGHRMNSNVKSVKQGVYQK
jgi:hypothetical protein